MQEHEFMHEYEYDGEQTHEIVHAEIRGKIGDVATLAEIDEVQTRQVARWKCRLLVLTFYSSFLTCLAALWFSGTLISAPDGFLSPLFLQFMADHRLLILSVPVAILVVCYFGLRHLTREIMTVPERYLDERQKMLRDQAHRSAFKLVKLACLLIPCGFLLPHLPWFNHSTSVAAQTPIPDVWHPYISVSGIAHATTWQTIHIYDSSGVLLASTQNRLPIYTVLLHAMPIARTIPPTIAPASTTEMAVAGGLLLLCLLLMASALPMTTLAWKGKL